MHVLVSELFSIIILILIIINNKERSIASPLVIANLRINGYCNSHLYLNWLLHYYYYTNEKNIVLDNNDNNVK